MPLITFTPNTVIKSGDVTADLVGLANGTLMNSPIFDKAGITNLQQVSGLKDNGNSGAAATINWANGDRQKITITANTTLSYSNQLAGQILTLEVIMDGTGGWTITLPTSKWQNGAAGVFTTTALAKNILVVEYDGADNLTQLSPGFS